VQCSSAAECAAAVHKEPIENSAKGVVESVSIRGVSLYPLLCSARVNTVEFDQEIPVRFDLLGAAHV
jgi:hypothetical protein